MCVDDNLGSFCQSFVHTILAAHVPSSVCLRIISCVSGVHVHTTYMSSGHVMLLVTGMIPCVLFRPTICADWECLQSICEYCHSGERLQLRPIIVTGPESVVIQSHSTVLPCFESSVDLRHVNVRWSCDRTLYHSPFFHVSVSC